MISEFMEVNKLVKVLGKNLLVRKIKEEKPNVNSSGIYIPPTDSYSKLDRGLVCSKGPQVTGSIKEGSLIYFMKSSGIDFDAEQDLIVLPEDCVVAID